MGDEEIVEMNKLKLGLTLLFSIVVVTFVTISVSYYKFTKLEVYE